MGWHKPFDFPTRIFVFSRKWCSCKHPLISHSPCLLWKDIKTDEELARYNQEHHKKLTFIVMFTESRLRRRKITDILHSGDAYKSIPTPSLPPPPLPSTPHTHAHTPFAKKELKIKTVPSCEGTCLCNFHTRVLFTSQDLPHCQNLAAL